MKRTQDQDENQYTYIEYIENLCFEKNIYFAEHETEFQALVSCAKYNIFSDFQHKYVGIRNSLIETIRKTTRSEDEYQYSINLFLNSI